MYESDTKNNAYAAVGENPPPQTLIMNALKFTNKKRYSRGTHKELKETCIPELLVKRMSITINPTKGEVGNPVGTLTRLFHKISGGSK